MERTAGHLPVHLTSFIGREVELRKLGELFGAGARLVTLFGPAGIGKTRLAVRHAEQRLGPRAIFCDLTTAGSVEDVCRIFACSLDVDLDAIDPARRVERLAQALAAQDSPLLVVDNCDQVVEPVALAVARCCALSGEARFLVTSRELLGIPGEQAFEVGPLPLPRRDDDTESDAVRLFVERARLVRSGFDVTPDNACTVATLVRELEGLPLALELTAGCLDVFGPADLLERLPRRFDDFANRERGGVERQRTLRAAFESSWRLLRPWEQSALAACGVFQGSFSVESAEAVIDLSAHGGSAPPVSAVLAALRAKSLVRAIEPRDAPSRGRLDMYESIRSFARENLDASQARDAVALRHSAHFVRLASRALDARAPELSIPEPALAQETDNLLAVHARALAETPPDVNTALRVALALEPVLSPRSLPDVLSLLDAGLSRAERGVADARLMARACVARARVRFRLGEVAGLRAETERALEIARAAPDGVAEGRALLVLAELAFADRIEPAVVERCEEALHVQRQAGDPYAEAYTLALRATAEEVMGRFEEARRHFEESIECAASAGCTHEEAFARSQLGHLLWTLGDTEAAIELQSSVVELAERAGQVYALAKASVALARIFQEQGKFEEARAHYARARELFGRHRNRLLGLCFGYSATLLHEQGDFEGARRGYSDALRRLHEAGLGDYGAFFRGALGAALATQGQIDEAAKALDEPWRATGSNAGLAEALGLLRGHLDLAMARACRQDDPQEAAQLHARAAERLARVDPAYPYDDVRIARRLLVRALRDGADECKAGAACLLGLLVVGEEARWLRLPAGKKVELPRQRAQRNILLALARHRLSRPGEALAGEDLVARGWPGERMRAKSALARLRVAISRLRALGLRDFIVTRDDGYLFRADLGVGLDGEAASGA